MGRNCALTVFGAMVILIDKFVFLKVAKSMRSFDKLLLLSSNTPSPTTFSAIWCNQHVFVSFKSWSLHASWAKGCAFRD